MQPEENPLIHLMDVALALLSVVFILTMYGVGQSIKNPHISDAELHSRVFGRRIEYQQRGE